MKTLFIVSALVLGASAFGEGRPVNTPPPVCSWPAWQNCGNTNGDLVNMTCAAAKAEIAHYGEGYFNTEDGGTIGPVYATVQCGGDETTILTSIHTTDEQYCQVGEACQVGGR